MTRTPITALVALAVALAGCGNAAGGLDHSDAQDVARAYAIADHEHDHKTVYNLLHLSVIEGADRQEWVAQQEELMADEHQRYEGRYEDDDGNARNQEPRQVEEVETARSSLPGNAPDNATAVDVVAHFADGERETFAYMLIETAEGWRVAATRGR